MALDSHVRAQRYVVLHALHSAAQQGFVTADDMAAYTQVHALTPADAELPWPECLGPELYRDALAEGIAAAERDGDVTAEQAEAYRALYLRETPKEAA